MSNQERIEKIRIINQKIFELEESFLCGDPIRQKLYQARIDISAADHLIRVELGWR